MRIPYFNFYPRDFMSAITHLDNECRGAYMNILCHLWEVEFSSKKDLIFVGFFEKKETKKVLEKWMKIECILCVNNEGFYYSKRMEDEREKALQRYEKNRINGEKGGRKKAENANPTLNPMVAPTLTPQGNLNNNPNSSQMSTTQNQSHISNIPTEYIDKEDSLFLAREAQENQEPKKIEFEKIDRSVQNQYPSIEDAQAHVDYHALKFKNKFDVVEWIAHWTAQEWKDVNGKPFEWKRKINDNASDPRFQIKAEKTTTPKKGWTTPKTKTELESERIKSVLDNLQKSQTQNTNQQIQKPILRIEPTKEFDINDEEYWNDTRKYF